MQPNMAKTEQVHETDSHVKGVAIGLQVDHAASIGTGSNPRPEQTVVQRDAFYHCRFVGSLYYDSLTAAST
jgi:hypothetical protein